jgi:hypothetical protein
MSCPGDNWIVPGANPCNQAGGVDTITAATPNVTIGGTANNVTIGVTNTGGVTLVEGLAGNINLNGVGMTIVGGTPVAQDITFTAAVQSIASANGTVTITQPTAGNYNLSVTPSSGGASDTANFRPTVNPVFAGGPAVDGDTAMFSAVLPFTGVGNNLIGNLATANTIIVNVSCGPILGAPTSGSTNASYFSVKAKTSGGTGTANFTTQIGQYVVGYGATIGGDFTITLLKARSEFFADTTSIQLYITNLPGVSFSNAVQLGVSAPSVYVSITAF